MSYRRLPLFDSTIQVSADTAKQDKVRVKYGTWTFHDIAGEAFRAATQIAQEEHVIPRNQNSATRAIFNTPRDYGYRSRSVQFTKRPINDQDCPLYGLPLATGTLDFSNQSRMGRTPFPEAELERLRRQREEYFERRSEALQAGQEFEEPAPSDPDDFEPTPYHITAQLTLNPTRMINHQYLRDAASQRNEPGFTYPEVTLLTSRRGVADGNHEGEFTLADHDNVIIDVRRHLMSQPPHYRQLRNNYFYAWLEFFDQRLRAQLEDPDMPNQFAFQPRFSLQSVENYHEFQCDNPLQAIESLRPHIRTLSQRVRNLRIRDWSQSDYIQGNEIGYRVDLAQGLELVVYAKTNKRIRVEARTTLDERLNDRHFPFTARTTSDLEGMITLMEATAEDAATYVNRALDVLRPWLPGGPSHIEQAPPYELVREIMRAVNDEHRDLADNAKNRRRIADAQQQLLSLILSRDGCAPMPQQRLRRAVQRLQRRGVLVAPNSGRVRALAPKYQRASEVLRAEVHGGEGYSGQDTDE
ncbi:hypothetical protein [Phaeobacter inhibens]|uniref:hypothetical protein n=1 Tax=Phaeobacter inhibens TaxID=221822 RepID=UPI0021A8FD07|nr:hypothetical protein [Phaeobacter inhibens]UWR44623.1 hypothetical protein K4F86_14955 [Phaeobacter inhibens]